LRESGQLHAPAALLPGKEPAVPIVIRGWVEPRAGLDGVEGILGPSETRAPTPLGTKRADNERRLRGKRDRGAGLRTPDAVARVCPLLGTAVNRWADFAISDSDWPC
jgi:hypothetical protein